MIWKFELSTEEEIKHIYANINATKESIETDVQYLMQWMEQQPHLPEIKDEKFLANFLVGCKNSLEKTKKRINSYYIAKAKLPDVYTNRDPCSAEFKKCMSTMFAIFLPKLTPDNCRIVINGFGAHNEGDLPEAKDVLKLYSSGMDVQMKTDLIDGYISIYDLTNIDSALQTLILKSISTSVQMLKTGPPMRLRKIYVLNLPPALQVLLSFSIKLLGEKLSNRIVVWKKDLKDLIEIFPKDVLPSDYGGTEMSIDELKENSLKRLMHYRDWFLSTDAEKADLSRIPTASRDDDFSVQGMEGSFRKLVFD